MKYFFCYLCVMLLGCSDLSNEYSHLKQSCGVSDEDRSEFKFVDLSQISYVSRFLNLWKNGKTLLIDHANDCISFDRNRLGLLLIADTESGLGSIVNLNELNSEDIFTPTLTEISTDFTNFKECGYLNSPDQGTTLFSLTADSKSLEKFLNQRLISIDGQPIEVNSMGCFESKYDLTSKRYSLSTGEFFIIPQRSENTPIVNSPTQIEVCREAQEWDSKKKLCVTTPKTFEEIISDSYLELFKESRDNLSLVGCEFSFTRGIINCREPITEQELDIYWFYLTKISGVALNDPFIQSYPIQQSFLDIDSSRLLRIAESSDLYKNVSKDIEDLQIQIRVTSGISIDFVVGYEFRSRNVLKNIISYIRDVDTPLKGCPKEGRISEYTANNGTSFTIDYRANLQSLYDFKCE